MNIIRQALRSIRREFFSRDLMTLFAALLLAVTVLTSVAILFDRIALTLRNNAAEILGGNLGLSSQQEIPMSLEEEALRRGLKTTRLVRFPTMLFYEDAYQMASIRAVDAHYPLYGQLLAKSEALDNSVFSITAPSPGEALADQRLMDSLKLKVGDRIELGTDSVKITGILHSYPDLSEQLLQLAPTLMIHRTDANRTGLLEPGSRARYRLMFAGSDQDITSFEKWLKPRHQNMRLLTADTTQHEMHNTFQRASQFLATTALLTVLLAGLATALTVNRFAVQRVNDVAVLRCLGAKQRDILSVLIVQLLFLAIPACGLGVVLGWMVQKGLIEILGHLIPGNLSPLRISPILGGIGIGFLLLLGFGLPPLLRLRNISPIRILNKSFTPLPPLSLVIYLAALLTIVFTTTVIVNDRKLVFWILGGILLLALTIPLIGTVILRTGLGLHRYLHGPWKWGLTALGRHYGLSTTQLTALSLSLCALFLLTAITPALWRQWHAQLPVDTPNFFLINIQPGQARAVQNTLEHLGAASPKMEPFGTGRLLAINNQLPSNPSLNPLDENDEDNANQPVNFSWRHTFPEANTLIAGRFWEANSTDAVASVEKRWAERYNVTLGDRLTLQIGDQQHTFQVTSIRSAEWDSFRVNFFLLLNAGAIPEGVPHNLICSIYFPADQSLLLNTLTRQFPNISIIDIKVVLQQAQSIVNRSTRAAQVMTGFGVLTGLLVFLATLHLTSDERRYDYAVLRTLGARRRQLYGAILVEFGILGLFSALLAAIIATIIGKLLAQKIFELALVPPWGALTINVLLGMTLSIAAGWWSTRHTLKTSPLPVLYQAG